MASGTRTVDKLVIVPAIYNQALTSVASKAGAWVSMKGFNNLTIIIATGNLLTPTASAVTVSQAKFVNGANTKACQLDYVWQSNDVANSVALTQVAVVSNTFNTVNTANANSVAILEIRADRMDIANGFTALQVNMAQAANQTANVTYIMGNVPRYAGGSNSFMNPLVD